MSSDSNSANHISNASLYTDFSGLQKLRGKVSQQASNAESLAESQAANKEVAKQFESLFLQMMLKTMRDATITGDSTESDQTRFYQEMFDKQIALDLANKGQGGTLGIAAMLENDLSMSVQSNNSTNSSSNDIDLIRNQINRSGSVFQSDVTSNADVQE